MLTKTTILVMIILWKVKTIKQNQPQVNLVT